MPQLVGQRWVSPTRTLPALELTDAAISNGSGLVAVLFEPRITGLGNDWLRFTGYEVLTFGQERQLVIQEWRCHAGFGNNDDRQTSPH